MRPGSLAFLLINRIHHPFIGSQINYAIALYRWRWADFVAKAQIQAPQFLPLGVKNDQ